MQIMKFRFQFRSARFNLDKENWPKVSDFKGESIRKWLIDLLKNDGVDILEEKNSWEGWSNIVAYENNKYLITCFGMDPEGGEDSDYDQHIDSDCEDDEEEYLDRKSDVFIRVHKYRSLLQRFLGKNKLNKNDPIFLIIKKHILEINDISRYALYEE